MALATRSATREACRRPEDKLAQVREEMGYSCQLGRLRSRSVTSTLPQACPVAVTADNLTRLLRAVRRSVHGSTPPRCHKAS